VLFSRGVKNIQMAKQTKEQLIKELQLKIKKQDLIITCLEQNVKDKEQSISDIKKIVSRQNDEKEQLKSNAKFHQKRNAELVLSQINKLEAVKMLFDVMSSETQYSTHRMKHLFACQSKGVIDIQIKELKDKLKFDFDETDLPF